MTVETTERILTDMLERADPSLAKQQHLVALLSALPLSDPALLTRWQQKAMVYPQELSMTMVQTYLHFRPAWEQEMLKRSDRTLLWLNLLLLLCIVFIPFPTALVGQYPEQQITIVIYGGTLVITGLVLQLLWWYATSGYHLVDREIDPRLVQRATRRNLTAPLVYLLAIGVSFLSVQISLIFFILVPLYYIFPGRIDRHWIQRNTDRVDEARHSPDGDADSTGEKGPPSRISVKER